MKDGWRSGQFSGATESLFCQRAQPTTQFILNNGKQRLDMVIAVVEAGDISKGFTAGTEKAFANLIFDLFECFNAISGECRGNHCDMFLALTGQLGNIIHSLRPYPLLRPKLRLEGTVNTALLPAESFA